MNGTRKKLSISTPNDPTRKDREIEIIRKRLIAAEQSGISTRTVEQILAAAKEELRRNGEL